MSNTSNTNTNTNTNTDAKLSSNLDKIILNLTSLSSSLDSLNNIFKQNISRLNTNKDLVVKEDDESSNASKNIKDNTTSNMILIALLIIALAAYMRYS